MKRSLFCIVVLIVILTGCISKPEVVELTENDMQVINDSSLQIVLEVEEKKGVIFDKLVSWIERNFVTGDSEAIIQDKEKGHLNGVGNTLVSVAWRGDSYPINYIYKYNFDIKDNKIRFTISDIYFYQRIISVDAAPTELKKYVSGAEQLEIVSKRLSEKGLLNDIRAAVEVDSSDW